MNSASGSGKRYEMNCESYSECTSWRNLFRAVDVMVYNIDMNGDNLIDFAEFCTLLSRAKQMRMRHAIFRAAAFVVPKSKRTEPFDYLQKYKCLPPPVIMPILSIIQIAVYVYYVIESGEGVQINRPVPINSPLIFDPYKKTEVWRYLTYMFIHIGVYHVVFNVITQLILGLPLELVHQWRTILVYLGGVIAGSLLVSATDPRVYLAGASGGVYALLAAHVAELVMNWNEMEFAVVRAVVLLILVSSDLFVSVYQRHFVGENANKVSYVSHIGGFVAGVLLGIVLLRNFKRHDWEQGIWWAALVGYVLFMVVCVVIIIAPPIF